MKTEVFDHLAERIEQTLAANRAEEALSLVEEARATDDDPRLRREQARILSALGHFGDALVELEPLAADDFPAEAATILSWTLARAGQPDLALPLAESGVDKLPGTEAAVFSHIVLAGTLERLGRPGDGVAVMERAVAARPEDPKARAWLARLLRAAGRKEEALDTARSVLDVAPEHPIALTAFGFTLLDLGRTADALATFVRAVEVAPREADLWLGKGTAEQKLGKIDEAIASLERGVEMDPSGGRLRRQLALLLSVSDRVVEALAQARRVTELAPHSSGAWGVLAMVLINSGDRPGGLDAFAEALRHPPVEPWVENLAIKYGLPKNAS